MSDGLDVARRDDREPHALDEPVRNRKVSRGSGQTLSEATVARASAHHWRPLWAQFLIFSVVGLANTAVDAGVFALLVGVFGWRDGFEPVAASVLGFFAGSLHSYLWNSRVTFGRGGLSSAESPRLLARFLVVAIGGAIVSALVFSAVRAVWPFGRFVLTGSKLAAMAVALAWNFSFMRFWVFASRHPKRALLSARPDEGA